MGVDDIENKIEISFELLCYEIHIIFTSCAMKNLGKFKTFMK